MSCSLATQDILASRFPNRGSIGEAVDWAKNWACVAKNFKRTLMIPGNHDECFDSSPERFEALVSMM